MLIDNVYNSPITSVLAYTLSNELSRRARQKEMGRTPITDPVDNANRNRWRLVYTLFSSTTLRQMRVRRSKPAIVSQAVISTSEKVNPGKTLGTGLAVLQAVKLLKKKKNERELQKVVPATEDDDLRKPVVSFKFQVGKRSAISPELGREDAESQPQVLPRMLIPNTDSPSLAKIFSRSSKLAGKQADSYKASHHVDDGDGVELGVATESGYRPQIQIGTRRKSTIGAKENVVRTEANIDTSLPQHPDVML